MGSRSSPSDLGGLRMSSRGSISPRSAYARSGVDVAAGERAVELMREAVESTRRPEVIGGLGGFDGFVWGVCRRVRDRVRGRGRRAVRTESGDNHRPLARLGYGPAG